VETQPLSPQPSTEAKEFHAFVLTSGLFQEISRREISGGSMLIFLRRKEGVASREGGTERHGGRGQ
jgi:hypothetical protein